MSQRDLVGSGPFLGRAQIPRSSDGHFLCRMSIRMDVPVHNQQQLLVTCLTATAEPVVALLFDTAIFSPRASTAEERSEWHVTLAASRTC